MRKLILSAFSTIALLIYPLSLSAQNNFSLSLDADDATGDQAVTSLNTSPEQAVAIQIFGRDIQNASSLSVRFEYDANQVVFQGIDVGDVLPNAQALTNQGVNPTFVEVGIASFGGRATVNSGLLGTIRFRTMAEFSGTAIRLVQAKLGRGGQFETVTLNMRVALSAPEPVNFSLSLDADDAMGDQAVTSLNASPEQAVAIQIFSKNIQDANSLSVRFEYDASQAVFQSIDVGDVLPNAQAVTTEGTNPTFVEVAIASFGGRATVNSGLLGTIRFRTMAEFSGTAIRLVQAKLGRGGRFEVLTLSDNPLEVTITPPPLVPVLSVRETAIDFGTVEEGQAVQQTIAIANTGTAPLEITGIASDVSGLVFEPSAFTLEPDGSQAVTVTFLSSTVGEFSGRIDISSNDPERATQTLSVSVMVRPLSVEARSDFDGNGVIDFADFLRFVRAFGSSESKYDLNGNGTVDFPDFLMFVQVFGKTVN